MNSSAISVNYLRSRSSKLWTGSTSLVYAFSLPPNRTLTTSPRSAWAGSRVCRPKFPFISHKFNVTTKRRKLRVLAQSSDNANLNTANAEQAESSEENHQDVQNTQITVPSNKRTPIWLFVVESAVQVTILALAIAGSIHTRRRALMHLVAVLSVPQVILIANRIWRRISSSPPVLSGSVDPSTVTDELEAPVSESDFVEATSDQRPSGGELTTVQSKLISTGIRTAVADEVSSLRFAIEQVEQTMEQRQQSRNLAIAEAIAGLDENLRGLRRSVDTRNQAEKSAPFALVSELEILKSRLKQSEREKTELEIRLRAAEENFEEAKRRGERARREADEANSKELGLRTEIAVTSSRLLRLEELTERLDRTERMNDELQEQVLNRTREQEGLRQSAEDAERRVVKVENIARILRDKVQELTGRPLPKNRQDDGDGFGERKEKADEQFWPQRLRGKADLRPDSVVYQELLREQKKSNTPLWPRDPLGIERERQEAGQQKMQPDDGGFGTGDEFPDNTGNDNSANKMLLSPEGGSDVMFSFSRGEFDKSSLKETVTEQSEEYNAPTVPQKTRGKSSKGSSSQSEETIPPSVERSGTRVSTDDSILASPQVEEARNPNSSIPTIENDQSKPGPLSEATEQDGEYVQHDESISKEETDELVDRKLAGTVQNDSSPLTAEIIDQDQRGARNGDDRESELVQSQSHVTHSTADGDSEQLEEKPQESEVSPDVTSVSEGNELDHENQQSVTLETDDSDGMQYTPDQAHISQRNKSSTQDSQQPSTVVESGEPEGLTEQKTSSYLESLSRNDEMKSVETTEDLIQNARELVKKARVRGLAVKQADVLFARAGEKLERAIQELDDSTQAEADLGECLLAWAKTNIANPHAGNRLSKALELLRSSAESRPDDETILFNTGLCLCLMASTSTEEKAVEDYKMACDVYERLLRVNYNSRIACFNCGLAYVSLGRLSLGKGMDVEGCFERAAVLFERSLELKPGDSKAISYLDDCRRQLANLN